MSATIKSIHAREILDSRGNPTVETTVVLSDKSGGVSAVPSGASVGKYEALELRDGDSKRFQGMGVLKAVSNVNQRIFPLLKSLPVEEPEKLDQLMIDLDGSENKSQLGANAILSVSQALLVAAASSAQLPLYRYFQKRFLLTKKLALPKPTFNLINAGKHGSSPVEFQEFHLLPLKQKTFAKNLQIGEEIYQSLKEVLVGHKLDIDIGDEGGFSPHLLTNLDALDLLRQATKEAGYQLNTNVALGLDCAANNFYQKEKYRIHDFAKSLSAADLINFYQKLIAKYKIRYLEDPLAEDDWLNWQNLTLQLINKPVLVVGDDLLCTNLRRLEKAIATKAANAILIKPNQIGTISETLGVIKAAKKAKWKVIVSHRSGETTDTFIADFAVGVGADLVKFGAPARGERVAKYNRLLEIEEELNQ